MTIESLSNTNPVFGEEYPPRPLVEPDHHAHFPRLQSGRRRGRRLLGRQPRVEHQRRLACIEGERDEGGKLSRQLVVFNDTFAGTAVDVSWEMHQDSATGALADHGTTQLNIPLGQHMTTTIQVSAPPNGTTAVLILQSSKNSQVIFRDDGQVFTLK